jgi:predicted metallopeptidase
MKKIIEYLKCGLIEQPSKRKEVRYVVYNFNDHSEIIIPFFNVYKLLTVKQLDFNAFFEVFNLIKEKNKLNEEDLLKIKCIKSSMNKNRKTFI